MVDIVELYNKGFSLRHISRITGIKHCHTIRNQLIKKGVKIRSYREQMLISNKNPERNKKLSKSLNGRVFTKEHGDKISYKKLGFKITKDFLIQKYYNENKSCRKIAEETGCCRATIERWLKKFNIKIKNHSSYPGYWKNRKNPKLSRRNLIDNPMKKSNVRKKVSISMKKRFENKEEREKLLKNSFNPKGKSYVEIMGSEERVMERILKRKKTLFDNPEIVINASKKISKALTGKKKSKEHVEKIKRRASMQIFPKKDTSIEVKLQNFLREIGIDFYTHFYIGEIKHFYRCDIYILSMNLIIEADGDYWHGNLIKFPILSNRQKKQRKKDDVRTKELLEKGYNVIRIWENEIRKMTLNDFKNVIRIENEI